MQNVSNIINKSVRIKEKEKEMHVIKKEKKTASAWLQETGLYPVK